MSKARSSSSVFKGKCKILFDDLPIPSYAWKVDNNDLILTDFNGAAHEFSNGKIENYINIKASELYDDQPEILEDLRKCAREKSKFYKELKYKFKFVDSERYLSVNYGFIPPDIVVVHVNDITEKKLAEKKSKELQVSLSTSEENLRRTNEELKNRVSLKIKELKDSQEKYRLLSENANDIIGILNEKYEIEHVNEHALKKTSGYDLEDVLGKNTLQFLHPEDVKAAVKGLEIGKERGEGLIDLRFRLKDGSFKWFECSGKIFKDINNMTKGIIILRDISDRKDAEMKLKESEEKFRLIAENSDDLIRVRNDKYQIEYINENAHKKLLGYSKEDLLRRAKQSLRHPDEYEQLNQFLRDLTKNGEATQEGRLLHKKGYWKWFDIRAKLYQDHNNEWKGLIISRDITEKKQAELKLKESEMKYRLISENANDLISMFSLIRGRIFFSYINEKVHEKLLGYAREDMIGKKLIAFLHPDEIESIINYIKQNWKKGKGSVVLRFKKKDGGYAWLETYGTAFRDANGKLIGVTISRDITQKIQDEKKLKESEERYRLILENSGIVVWSTDMNLNLTYVSPTSPRILGYKVDETIKWPINKRTTSDSLKKMAKIFKDEMKLERKTEKDLERSRTFEIDQIHKNGSIIPSEVTFTFLRDDDKRAIGILGMTRDISERKKAEHKLKESEKKYRKAFDRANFYKDLFAHDINNILQIINSSIELITLQIGNFKKFMDIESIIILIRNQIIRARKLVNNVNTLSALEQEEKPVKLIEMCELLNNSIKYVKNIYPERNIKIQTEFNGKRIFVEANELLQDVFDNILNNAVKYNDRDLVRISIIISKINKDEKNMIKLEFIDNGIGVMDEHKKMIFKRGYRKHKGQKGMGLGLSLVKKIIDSYDGEIWVENKIKGDYSQGSKFIILISEAD
ncbi:MAG: PAS domain-containing sensor histidine kinase [Promethearchaeota archaeon]|nr:MAG: PAS domain-containing sensor histidine kinase [Candidatus Lokiarchaeota archaeon]